VSVDQHWLRTGPPRQRIMAHLADWLHLLLLDDVFGEPSALRRSPEPAPGLQTRALQVDHSDIASRSQREIRFKNRRFDHLPSPTMRTTILAVIIQSPNEEMR